MNKQLELVNELANTMLYVMSKQLYDLQGATTNTLCVHHLQAHIGKLQQLVKNIKKLNENEQKSEPIDE